jgi:hypothetical protein
LRSLVVATACVALLSSTVGSYYFTSKQEAAYVAPLPVANLTVPQVKSLIEKNLPSMVRLHGHFVSRQEAVSIAAVLDAELGDSIVAAYPGVQRFRDRIAGLGYRFDDGDSPHTYVMEVADKPVSESLFVESLTFVWLADRVRWDRKTQSMKDFFLNVKPLQGNPADRVQIVHPSRR